MSRAQQQDWPALAAMATAVREGSNSAAGFVDQALARIAATNDTLNAVVGIDAEGARQRAAAIDARRARGERLGPLAGVPVVIKDNLLRRGWPCTCGSRILEDFVAPYSATVVERLEAADAVLVGRSNMDEFGMGSSTTRSIHGPTRHPRDPQRSPGGSSGGSAAAVAAGMVPLALGSDTGGSVRQPAGFCGIFGLKPSYGRLSRWGLVAYASSLDCVGLLGRSAADLEYVLGLLSGPDPRDPTHLAQPATRAETAVLAGMRLGTYLGAACDPAVQQAFAATQDRLRAAGCELAAIDLPHLDAAIPTYYLIASAEASSNLSRFDGMRYGRRSAAVGDLQETISRSRSEGLGAEVQRRILLGCFALSAGQAEAWYHKACQVRTLVRRDFAAAFAGHDLLLMPASLGAAWDARTETKDPARRLARDMLTVPASLAGLPALSLPMGEDTDGMPLGMQVLAPLGEESRLLAFARALADAGGAA